MYCIKNPYSGPSDAAFQATVRAELEIELAYGGIRRGDGSLPTMKLLTSEP